MAATVESSLGTEKGVDGPSAVVEAAFPSRADVAVYTGTPATLIARHAIARNAISKNAIVRNVIARNVIARNVIVRADHVAFLSFYRGV
jgi:hypothetical protein